jgi:hypothetical protein
MLLNSHAGLCSACAQGVREAKGRHPNAKSSALHGPAVLPFRDGSIARWSAPGVPFSFMATFEEPLMTLRCPPEENANKTSPYPRPALKDVKA